MNVEQPTQVIVHLSMRMQITMTIYKVSMTAVLLRVVQNLFDYDVHFAAQALKTLVQTQMHFIDC